MVRNPPCAWLLVLLSLSTLLAAGCGGGLTDPAVPIVWTESSLTRIWRLSPPGADQVAEVYAARNETCDFQIGIKGPASGLVGVQVTASNLVGPGGSTIPASDISLFREQYIYVPTPPQYYWRGSRNGTNPPRGAGWYPDGLIPFVDPETGLPAHGGTLHAEPFFVPAGMNQPIWVDLTVPKNASAGAYSGRIHISTKSFKAAIQVHLHVWNFALPETPSLKTSFQAHHQNLLMAHELLRNRVSPDWDNPSDERNLIDHWGLTATNLWFSSGLGVSNCSTKRMPSTPSINQFEKAAAEHQPDILIYNFTADEIGRCPQVFATLKRWAANMHAAGVKNLVTVEPVPALEDDGTGSGRSAVDIWTVLPEQYDEAQREGGQITKVLEKGDAVWIYNVLVQDGYSPKMEINFSPLDFRLTVGFISQSLGITGFQQWEVDQWSSNPWRIMIVSPGGVPSDGFLVYPGRPVGIVGYAPSMRLKWIRDGVDDYEYVQILKNLGEGSWALKQAASVGSDWRRWARDYKEVELVRIHLGSRINQIKRFRIAVPRYSSVGHDAPPEYFPFSLQASSPSYR